jgi:hypothetical protein
VCGTKAGASCVRPEGPVSGSSLKRACQRQTTTLALEIEHRMVVCFRREAQQRDVPVTRLIHDLLDVIVADGLTTAILDDGDVSSP